MSLCLTSKPRLHYFNMKMLERSQELTVYSWFSYLLRCCCCCCWKYFHSIFCRSERLRLAKESGKCISDYTQPILLAEPIFHFLWTSPIYDQIMGWAEYSHWQRKREKREMRKRKWWKIAMNVCSSYKLSRFRACILSLLPANYHIVVCSTFFLG